MSKQTNYRNQINTGVKCKAIRIDGTPCPRFVPYGRHDFCLLHQRYQATEKERMEYARDLEKLESKKTNVNSLNLELIPYSEKAKAGSE
ncbi:MAG: hypothetical protein JW963_08985 [Anaerolineales bacterium]|nr:hypothetical protein [Anaerolineales bacterium]